MTYLNRLSAIAAICLFFAACGDDSGNNSNANASTGGCTVSVNKDKTSYTLSCADGTEVVIGFDGKVDDVVVAKSSSSKTEISSKSSSSGKSASSSSGTAEGTSSDKVGSIVGQGYVQFNADAYNSLQNTMLYLYDTNNKNSRASVILRSFKTGDSLQVDLLRAEQYFYGSFKMSVRGGDGVLKVLSIDTISVEYGNASTGTLQRDYAAVALAGAVSITFGADKYFDDIDKAVILLMDESLTENDDVTVLVRSSNDGDRRIQMYPVKGGSGMERIGFVEFTTDDSKEGQVKVADGSRIRALYGEKSATAYWYKSGMHLVDERDGRMYKIVTIGDQTWMAENLNYGQREFTNSKYPEYGGYYHSRACPNGWHLPSNEEWETLIEAVGGPDVAGKALKSAYGWLQYCAEWDECDDRDDRDVNGEDSFGFSALPAGERIWEGDVDVYEKWGGFPLDGYFHGVGYMAKFCSSTRNDYDYAVSIFYDDRVEFYEGVYACSVRCVKN